MLSKSTTTELPQPPRTLYKTDIEKDKINSTWWVSGRCNEVDISVKGFGRAASEHTVNYG